MVALESLNLFKSLAAEELQTLRSIARESKVPASGEIFREGAPGDGVYFVKSGLVEISGLIGGDVRRVFSQLGPGEIFGEMAVIEDRPRSATAVAVKETEIYFIPREEMLALIKRSPQLAFSILQEVSSRLRDFDQLHLREVVQAERLAVVGNFARSIIHDLKTPLTIIGLSAEMACTPTSLPAKRAESLERIRKQIFRINDMVGDILEYTRSDRADAALSSIVYSDFMNEMLPDLKAETESKLVRIELQNEPPAVKTFLDSRRLRRVFFNLAHNAMDFLAGGGKIILRFSSNEKEVVTEFEDTGPGIAPEIADNLFQPFVTHGKAHGTGLGLSICKKIIEDHKGRIWVRSELRRGAIFCISLPLAK